MSMHIDDAFAKKREAARTFTVAEANILVSAMTLLRQHAHQNNVPVPSEISSILSTGWETA